MDLVIDEKKEESYKIQLGADVFNVSYPSWSEAKKIEKGLEKAKAKGDNDKVVDFIANTLVDLGLDKRFFENKAVKAHHVFKIWSEINSIKK